ncbi:MAG TPA: membrane protein insertase YidC [Candidatus Hydrogenedentes bacterium]|nr:membrane protein insertase YidC [Candidatus Hydrogenedentota bacterium]HIJ73578.1 membrane protein insertase YidC [Candidatus Hydrogenedentota bacterium]
MWDDDRNKKMMPRELIGIILIMLLFMFWFNAFLRPRTVPPEAPAESADVIPLQTPDAQPGVSPPAAPGPGEPQGQWAALPPIPDDEDPAMDEVTLENDDLRLVFTRIGARLKNGTAKLHMHGEDEQQLVPDAKDGPDSEAEYPFGLTFSEPALGDALDNRRFQVDTFTDASVAFSLTVPDVATIRKTYTLDEASYALRVRVDYENLAGRPIRLGLDDTPAYSLGWAPNVRSGDENNRMIRQLLIWLQNDEYGSLETRKLGSSDHGEVGAEVIRAPEWVGVKSAYFVVAMKPVEFETPRARAVGNGDRFRLSLDVPSAHLDPGQTLTNEFQVYLGPSQRDYLAAAWPTLPAAFRFYQSNTWAWLDWFSKLLLRILNFFYAIIPNYGVGIILLTILVRAAMYPLTLKSMRSMKKMQLLQPEMEEIRKKYQETPQEMNKKMMELYRERGVNPLGGCFPMLLQMPVFFAMFRMYATTFELRKAPFIWWISDLSQPDRLLYMPWMQGLPLLNMFEYLNLLPILMGVAMVLHQKIMPSSGPAQNPQQKMMMTFMPVFFSFICYNMAAGLSLYILTSTVLGMVQQKFVRPGEMKTKPKKPSRKRKHFYDVVRAHQREIKKEIRKKKHQTRTASADAKQRRRKKA